MSRLPVELFSEVFEPLQNRRIGYVRPPGNVGDLLIEAATVQLFAEFGIEWVDWTPENPTPVDELAYGGGGNMGAYYRPNWDLRTRCLETGLPVTILPQSFMSAEDRPFHRVFVRERYSLRYRPDAVLAPDLALGLAVKPRPAPIHALGIFLRRDGERKVRRRLFRRDPVQMCQTPAQYLTLASQYARLITDRLHFAVCGVLLGRETTLLPNSYHKNRGMYETWLAGLGCRFAESVPRALSGDVTDRETRWAG
jgi:exopolysaccharide biosynthesis predicted pyruvyltransferase EpsI